MLALRDVLKMPSMKDLKIVAGHKGVDREITTVTVMDAPDINKWMKGGEFLITSGYAIKDTPEYLEELIESLDKSGASALGIKFDRYIHQLPEAAAKMAEKLKFPIVMIPLSFAFTDVINPVLREVIDSQSKVLLYTEDVHRSFTNMVLEDAKIPSILKELQRYIHREAALLDLCFYKMYFSPDESGQTLPLILKDMQPDKEPLEEIIDKFDYYHLYINDIEYGYILLGERQEASDEDSMEKYHKVALEQAGIILILKLQKQLAEAQIESNYREQFVLDLLMQNFKSREEIVNRASVYGWSFQEKCAAVIVDIDRFKQQYLGEFYEGENWELGQIMGRVLKISKSIVGSYFADFVYSKLSDQIVFVISEADNEQDRYQERLKKLSAEIKDEIKKAISFTATIGIGSQRKDISEIYHSWDEAKKAIQISRNMLREDCVSAYEELGIFKLLSLVGTSEAANEFQSIYIEKLEVYDKKYHTEFLRTLLILCACGWNLKEASDNLYIHYNSMKYRYQKICKLLEMNLQEHEQRLNLEIALKLYQMKHPII